MVLAGFKSILYEYVELHIVANHVEWHLQQAMEELEPRLGLKLHRLAGMGRSVATDEERAQLGHVAFAIVTYIHLACEPTANLSGLLDEVRLANTVPGKGNLLRVSHKPAGGWPKPEDLESLQPPACQAGGHLPEAPGAEEGCINGQEHGFHEGAP